MGVPVASARARPPPPLARHLARGRTSHFPSETRRHLMQRVRPPRKPGPCPSQFLRLSGQHSRLCVLGRLSYGGHRIRRRRAGTRWAEHRQGCEAGREPGAGRPHAGGLGLGAGVTGRDEGAVLLLARHRSRGTGCEERHTSPHGPQSRAEKCGGLASTPGSRPPLFLPFPRPHVPLRSSFPPPRAQLSSSLLQFPLTAYGLRVPGPPNPGARAAGNHDVTLSGGGRGAGVQSLSV